MKIGNYVKHMNEIKQLRKLINLDVQENVVLRDYTTLKVGGVADYFYVARNLNELIRAVLAARELKIDYFILGSGSNVVISDYGFNGLVILNRSSNLVFLKENSQVFVDSGVPLAKLVLETAEHGLSGLEPLIGIPGTVGGAVYGNAGANGVEMAQFVKSVTVLSLEGNLVKYKTDWLKPQYRLTKLKEAKKQGREIPIILSIKLQLSAGKKEEIINRIHHWQKERFNKQPANYATCGSVFKNPVDDQKRGAGLLLDQSGAKKLRVGRAKVASFHANFINNLDNARAQEVKELIDEMKKLCLEKQGVELEEEVEYLGQWE